MGDTDSLKRILNFFRTTYNPGKWGMAKKCDKCQHIWLYGSSVCPECGYHNVLPGCVCIARPIWMGSTIVKFEEHPTEKYHNEVN